MLFFTDSIYSTTALNNFQNKLSKLFATLRCRFKNNIPGYTHPNSVMSENEPKGLTKEEVAAAVHDPDPSTKDFIMQQTMLRIKEPKRSLTFYSKVLGMRLLSQLHFPSMKFSLYFMGYADPKDVPVDEDERKRWMFQQPATVELTHNWGTETDDSVYHNGNSAPRGFGHIGISVPDVYAACARFDEFGVEYVKRPDGGKMKGLAFIKDPDGYWIEILNPNAIAK